MRASVGRSHGAGDREAKIEDAVRRMVARELHDRVAQTLTGMLVDVENFKSQQVGWEDVVRELSTIQSSTRTVLTNIRQLLHDLRGEDQVGDSFIEALADLVARFQVRSMVNTGLQVSSGWPEVLAPTASLNLYRIVEEALANVRMHSGATHARVVLQMLSSDRLLVMVEDDGRGVETDEARPVGLGTVGMRERAMILGGRLHVEGKPGVGTRVYAFFPRAHVVPSDPAELLVRGA